MISGTAGELEVTRPQGADADPNAHGGAAPSASALDAAIRQTEAKAALVGSGWTPAIARAAVAEAVAALGPAAALDKLVFEAMRQCGSLARSGVSIHAQR